MASAFTHAAVGLALGTAFQPEHPPARYWIAGAVCAAIPDIDVLGFRLGIPYDSFFGHRGFTHSLVFAALLATVVLIAAFPRGFWPAHRAQLWTYLFVATASHGLLDMLTNGGLGVALFSPFTMERFFFPWHAIEVSPLGLRTFFTSRGLQILRSEAVWIWIPAALFARLCTTWRRVARRPEA